MFVEALGPDGVLINIARGSLVDEAALIDALRNKTILAAGLDVFRHSFDEALRHPGVAARQAGAAALAAQCRACPLLRVCGGGHYAHRYRAGHGFRNPSVYCADLQRLIRHVAARLAGTAPAGPAPREGGTP